MRLLALFLNWNFDWIFEISLLSSIFFVDLPLSFCFNKLVALLYWLLSIRPFLFKLPSELIASFMLSLSVINRVRSLSLLRRVARTFYSSLWYCSDLFLGNSYLTMADLFSTTFALLPISTWSSNIEGIYKFNWGAAFCSDRKTLLSKLWNDSNYATSLSFSSFVVLVFSSNIRVSRLP